MLFSDGNVRVRPDFLRAVPWPSSRIPRVGLVSHLFRAAGAVSLPLARRGART